MTAGGSPPRGRAGRRARVCCGRARARVCVCARACAAGAAGLREWVSGRAAGPRTARRAPPPSPEPRRQQSAARAPEERERRAERPRLHARSGAAVWARSRAPGGRRPARPSRRLGARHQRTPEPRCWPQVARVTSAWKHRPAPTSVPAGLHELLPRHLQVRSLLPRTRAQPCFPRQEFHDKRGKNRVTTQKKSK